MTGLMEIYTADRAHIAHRGCECVECWHHARNRHDALAILRQSENVRRLSFPPVPGRKSPISCLACG